MFGDRGRDGEEGQERNVEEGVAGKRFSDAEGERGRRDELFEVEEPEGDVVSNTRFLCGGQACTIKVRGGVPMQSEARDELEGDSISVSNVGVQLVSEGSEGPDSRFEV